MLAVGVLKSLISLGIVVSSIGVLIHYSQGKELLMDEITNLAFSFPEESLPPDSANINQKNDSGDNLFLSELRKKLRFVLDVNSDYGWIEVLSVNRKSYSRSNIEDLKQSCKRIYNLSIDSLSEQEKQKYLDFAKLNCQLPTTSGRKFKENGLNYVEKSKNVEFDESIVKNVNFWSKVQRYSNLKGKDFDIKNDEDKFKLYCDRFPKFMTLEQGYTAEERDYLNFCLRK